MIQEKQMKYREGNTEHNISVVIATHDRNSQLMAAIESCQCQVCVPKEQL